MGYPDNMNNKLLIDLFVNDSIISKPQSIEPLPLTLELFNLCLFHHLSFIAAVVSFNKQTKGFDDKNLRMVIKLIEFFFLQPDEMPKHSSTLQSQFIFDCTKSDGFYFAPSNFL